MTGCFNNPNFFHLTTHTHNTHTHTHTNIHTHTRAPTHAPLPLIQVSAFTSNTHIRAHTL